MPFSNIAWRLAVSSAVAGALASGVIALMVCRGGRLILEGSPGLRKLAPHEERLLGIVAGFAAGMGFALDHAFWSNAVIVETWPLSLLLFSVALSLSMRWIYRPARRRYLYLAALAYGLLLASNQCLFAAAIGLEFLVVCGDRALGRDLLFLTFLLLGAMLLARAFNVLPEAICDDLCLISGAASAFLVIKTRRILTEWRGALATGFFLLLGLSFYLYLPIASMTTPPMNWGYPRTVEGFFHTISRGQYERLNPTANLPQFASQMKFYFKGVASYLGGAYLLLALFPLFVFKKIEHPTRRWILGLLPIYLFLSCFLVLMINPTIDRQSQEITAQYFVASHLVLCIWAGYGLVLLGIWLACPRDKRRSQGVVE